MSKFCENCGEELESENAKFCDKCGAEVKASTEQTNTGVNNVTPMAVCPKCGEATPSGQANCEKCGSPLENNTTAVIIGYIVTFLLGIVGIVPAIYLLTRSNGKAKTHGLILIALIIISIILNWFIGWPFSYVLMLLFVIAGIAIWYDDFSLFG